MPKINNSFELSNSHKAQSKNVTAFYDNKILKKKLFDEKRRKRREKKTKRTKQFERNKVLRLVSIRCGIVIITTIIIMYELRLVDRIHK